MIFIDLFPMDMTKSSTIKNFGYVIATKMSTNTLCHLGQFSQGKTVVLEKMHTFLCDFELHC